MEHSIATASVDLLGIKKRKYSDLSFRALQKIAGDPSEDVRSLLLYPAIESESIFADLRNRLGWYLPDGSYEQCDIHVLGDDSLREVADTPTEQATFQTDHLRFQTLICSSAYFVSGVHNWLQDGQQRERRRSFSA